MRRQTWGVAVKTLRARVYVPTYVCVTCLCLDSRQRQPLPQTFWWLPASTCRLALLDRSSRLVLSPLLLGPRKRVLSIVCVRGRVKERENEREHVGSRAPVVPSKPSTTLSRSFQASTPACHTRYDAPGRSQRPTTTTTMTDDSSRAPAVLAVSASTLVCCSLFVILRLVSRFGIVKKPAWDDYTIILAWILAFGTSFSICWGTSKGFGRHQNTIAKSDFEPMNKAAYAFSVLYVCVSPVTRCLIPLAETSQNPALMATKSSILIFYLTLSKTRKIFRWSTIATLIVVNVGGLALTLLNVFQCDPVSAAFHTPVEPPHSCINIVTIYLSSAPLNIITDLAIFFLPMPLLTGMYQRGCICPPS